MAVHDKKFSRGGMWRLVEEACGGYWRRHVEASGGGMWRLLKEACGG